jgi:putative peptidoglycan lipid II flippase
MLPNLSRLAAVGDERGFRGTLDWGMRVGVLLGLPAAVALYVLALPLVATLFHYGEMTTFDARMAALAVQAFAAGLLPLVLVKVMAPAYFAREDTRTPFRIAVVAVATNVILNLLTFRWFGHVGLALATSTAAWVNGALLLRGLVRSGRYVPASPVAYTTLRTCAASAVMAGALILLLPEGTAWLAMSALARAAWLGGGVAVGGAIFVVVLLIAGERPRQLLHRA